MCCSRLYTDNCLGKYPALTRQVVEDSVLSSISPPKKVKKEKKLESFCWRKQPILVTCMAYAFFKRII